VVGADVLFFRHHFWARLLGNVGIVLVFAAFHLRIQHAFGGTHGWTGAPPDRQVPRPVRRATHPGPGVVERSGIAGPWAGSPSLRHPHPRR